MGKTVNQNSSTTVLIVTVVATTAGATTTTIISTTPVTKRAHLLHVHTCKFTTALETLPFTVLDFVHIYC